mmetsp:Transcript_81133/g.211709  ORF Transcript_81133/g.211709 Transcript_81133/m.211709 type:complete len:207 (+) Transcript_81133:421-1041(+)
MPEVGGRGWPAASARARPTGGDAGIAPWGRRGLPELGRRRRPCGRRRRDRAEAALGESRASEGRARLHGLQVGARPGAADEQARAAGGRAGVHGEEGRVEERPLREPPGLLRRVRRLLGQGRRVQALLQDLLGQRRPGLRDQAGPAERSGGHHCNPGLLGCASLRCGRRVHDRRLRGAGRCIPCWHRRLPGVDRGRRARDQPGGGE